MKIRCFWTFHAKMPVTRQSLKYVGRDPNFIEISNLSWRST